MSFSCLVYVAASDYDALRRQYDALTQENERLHSTLLEIRAQQKEDYARAEQLTHENERLRKQVKEFKRGR